MKKGGRLFATLFTAPTFVLYTGFVILPIFFSMYYSLTDWDGVMPPEFMGLFNFKYLFSESDYYLVIKNTAIMMGYSLILQIPLGLGFAYLIYRTVKGFRFFRAVYFLPVVLAPAAIGIMFSLLLNSELGPVNKILHTLGLQFLEKQWLSDPGVVLYSVMFPMIWQYIGLYVIIFLAGLQTLPEDIFESAFLDGANSFQVFMRIVLPMQWEIIQIAVVLCFTGGLKAFDHPYIMTWGGPGLQSSYLGVYMYRTAFYDSDLGMGSAIAITILIFSILFTVTFKRLAAKTSIE